MDKKQEAMSYVYIEFLESAIVGFLIFGGLSHLLSNPFELEKNSVATFIAPIIGVYYAFSAPFAYLVDSLKNPIPIWIIAGVSHFAELI